MEKTVFDNVKADLVPKKYVAHALNYHNARTKAFRMLLEQRKLPQDGWSDMMIEEFVNYMASMDSNNFAGSIGVGEREARIACGLVARRHYNFGHGIGRSGDLLEAQPKAAGSTLMSHLTNDLLQDYFKMRGMKTPVTCFLVPMATGMTLSLCFMALRKKRPEAKYILWSRIDQKSCFKSMTSAGFTPVVIQLVKNADGELCTNVEAFQNKISELGLSSILCLFSTTSCFAPRACDNIEDLAKLAKMLGLPHVINNAYGMQCNQIMQRIERAGRTGRVEYFVQSTDKNFLVPVGGAIVAGFDADTVKEVGRTYAGRASSSQTLDVLMTLLSLGTFNLRRLVDDRWEAFNKLKDKIEKLAMKHNETVINSKGNVISLAMTLSAFKDCKNVTQIGSMLFTRGVSGSRVVAQEDVKIIDGVSFQNWGSHYNFDSAPYLTVAASIGIESQDVDLFIDKLDAVLAKFAKDTKDSS